MQAEGGREGRLGQPRDLRERTTEFALARSKKEFVSRMGGGLAELEEAFYWLELLARTNIVDVARLRPLRDEADELIRIFVTSTRTAKQEPHGKGGRMKGRV